MIKIKEQRRKLLIGLLIIPIMFILLITLIGLIITVLKDSNFTFNLLKYWKNAFNVFYYWVVALLLSMIMYFYYAYKICFNKKKEATLKATQQNDFGSANWLSEKELNVNYPLVSSNSIDNQHGFVVNSKMKKQELIYNIRTDTHSLVLGGTGSGKTQGIVLPTIAINANSKIKPSMIITDPKGELHQYQKDILISAGYNVQIINLRTVTESIAWNPLQAIYDQFKAMLLSTNPQEKLAIRVAIQSDIQDLSKTLFANNNQVEPFWNDSGALLTEAIILAMLEDVEIIITKENTSDQEEIKALLQTHLPVTKFNLASVTVIATMSTNLSIFKNEFIRNLTCNNDLNLNDFITKPTALFIVVPDENHNFYVFISLLISQIYKFLTQEASKTYPGKLTRPVYFLCDEFGNIPPIPNIESMITIARSRNIFFQLIIQELKQLENKYNKAIADIIFANCSLHIFLQTMNLETARYYSEIIGDTTVLQISTSGKGKSKSESETLKGHPLILASDAMKLSKNHAIVFYAKENPAKTSFIPWYQNHSLSELKTDSKPLNLINFSEEYYYDIKKKVTKKHSIIKSAEIKEKSKSKEQIIKEIQELKNKLKRIENETSIHYQELKLAIQRQIKYLEKLLSD
ncbi:MAG: type IV secretory system conjugative DNA transfer family protein [Spiroplasma sp.]